MTLTVADYFCGAGGSSSGMEQVPGVRIRMAANHWDLAIETHNANLPHADHDVADIAAIDPRRHPTTDIGWFSPECTHWSVARGKKVDYDGKSKHVEPGEEEPPLPDEAAVRSRMLMQDVPRFTEVHRYRAVLVENVTDVLMWEHLHEWLTRMHNLGYEHHIQVLNSAFAAALGPGAPQLRDRVYFVFWRREYQRPDFAKWCRPRAWCPNCETDVDAVMVDKAPDRRRRMGYGQQYFYRCPSVNCRGARVHPYALPAAAAIDWTIPAQRIGDRVRPLQPKTLARIEAGLRRYARPVSIDTAERGHVRSTWPVDQPLTALHAVPSRAIACPPFLAPLRSGRARTQRVQQPLATIVADGGNHALIDPLLVPVEGRDGTRARPINQPLRAQTARHENALVVPLRNNGVAKPADHHPLITFAANGTHHALVMRNNTPRGDAGQMSTPVNEPLRTITTAGHQSVLSWDHALYSYDTGHVRPLALPMPAQTTVQGDALLGPAIAVDDCTFRMLAVDEIRAGMAFANGYILLGTKREQVRMLGNAVTPPAARDLVAAVVEAITGDTIETAA